MYHELQHGKDFKFGQFDGLVDRDNLEVRKPLKATAQEVKDVAPFLSQYKPELREVEQNAEIAGRRASKKVYEQQQQQVLSTQLTNAYGLGGIKLDKVVNTQAVEAAKRTISINQLGEQSGISSPSAAKIVDRAITLKDRQKQIGLDIAKASNGELSTSQIEELQSRINKQVEGVENLSKRIDALKKSILKRVEQSKQVIPQPVEINIADPWAKSEGVVIDRDKAVEVARRAGQALNQTVNTGKSIVSGVKNTASNIATGAKSNYGLLQYGEAMLMNASPQARLIKSQIQTNIGDRIDDARYQIGSAVNASGQFAGSVYRGLKAAESVPLGLLPGGYTAKKLIQNVAVPTALFSAAHAVPGLNMMLDAASGGIHALAGGAGNLLSSGATSGMANFVSQALGSVPFSESVVPAVQQGLGAALNATITGGAEAAATFGAPVLIGKSIANIGTKSLGTGLQKLAQSNPLLPPAQAPLRLKPKAEPEYEYVEVQVQAKQIEASANKNPTTPNLPLNLPERKKEAKSVELAPPKLITQITESDGLARGKTLAKQFHNASKQIKEALKKGELELAFAMSQQIESFAKGATTEIANITSLLGDKAAFGTTLGSQLANTKSQITKARNTGIRAATVYQNSNPPTINDDELASLRVPTVNEVKSGISQKLSEFKKIFAPKLEPIPDSAQQLTDLGLEKQRLQSNLKTAKQKRLDYRKIASVIPVGVSIEEGRKYDESRLNALNEQYEFQQQAKYDGRDLREVNRKIRRIKQSIPSAIVEPTIVAVPPPTPPTLSTLSTPLGRPLPPPTSQVPITNSPLGRPLPTPTPPVPPPTPPVPPKPPLGRPLPPPDRIIPELAAKSFNQADLIASIEEKLNYFDNIYPQAENQVRGSEKRGRKNTKKFLRGVERNQDLFDSSFSRIDRESSQNLEQQIAKTQNLNDRVFTENGIVPLGRDVDRILPKLSDLRDMGGKVIATFAGFAGLIFAGKALSDFGRDAFQAAAKMESLRTTTGAVTSSSFKAQATIARSTTESNKLGYNALKSLENDGQLYASTKDTALENAAPDLLTGLKQYNRVMGVSEERAQLSQVSVQQIAGIGKIAAEELFGQLAESSPGAVNVIARSQGMSVGQLRKQVEEGGLNSNDVLPRFGNQLSAESLGSVDAASKSGAASVGRLQNSFEALKGAAGQQLMAPTILGMDAARAATDALKNNIDTAGKVFAATLLSAAASAVSLAGGLGLASPVLGFLVKGLILAIPLLKTFALGSIAAYGAIELFGYVVNSFTDSSPFKKIADDAEEAFAKIRKGADLTTQSIAQIKEKRYSEGRGSLDIVRDSVRGFFGADTSLTKKADDDTVNVDRLLSENGKALKRKPTEFTEANRLRRDKIDTELSIVRSENANLTTKDRDKIDFNLKREQKLIQERSNLEKPNNTRQAELGIIIKGSNSIIDDPIRNASEKGLAKLQLAEAEKEQRQLQAQLIASGSTLAIGLRKVGEGLATGIGAIDLASINRKTQTYLAAAQDPRNTGGLAQVNYTNTNSDLFAKQAVQQQAVNSLKATISEPKNRSIVKSLNIDPEKTSQEQIDFLKSTVTDTTSTALLGYLSKYQQVKTELAQTNQALFEGQYSYLKSIADYNRQLTEKVITLDNKLINLQISARSSINSLQQAIEEQLIEIDRTSGKAMLQAQKNRMQTAYNKFLDKLGISTDDIFEQIFQNYNSIIDSLGQMSDRRLNTKQSGVTAKYREKTNESRKTQVQTEQSQSNSEARRQNAEEKLNNPLNQLNPSNSETPPATPGEKSNLISPVKGGISSPFGWRTNPVSGKRKYHEGVDYPVPVGTSIKAAGDGVVTFAGEKSGYGYTIDLKHPSGESTRYAHASKIDVAVGQQIKQGDQIGLSGGEKGHAHSGASTGAHLHFETRNSKGVAVDPLKRLKQNSDIQSPVSTNSTLENTSLASTQDNINTQEAGEKLPQGEIFKMDSFTTPAKGSAPRREVNGPAYQPYTPTKTPNVIKQVPAVPGLPQLNPATTPKVPKRTIKAVPTVPALPNLATNSYTNVVSSFYTPGEGGAINGAKTDIRGKYIDRNSLVMATRTTSSPQGIPYGATVELRNPENGKTTIVKNVDRGTLRPGRDIDLTPAAANKLGVTPDGLANLQMRVIAVPKGQKIKDSYDLGGGIGSYDRKGNYTGKSGTIVKNKEIQDSTVDPKLEEQKKLNEFADRKKDELIRANEAASKVYVADTKRYTDFDTANAKKKLAQDRNLANQQDKGDLLNIDTKILQNRNLINRNVPIFNRKTVQLEREASAYNRSADRTPYQQIDKLSQQYGGTPDTTTLDTSITEAQSTFDRIKEDSRTRRENILKQIQTIEAAGAGWAETRKALSLDIAALRKRGEKVKADKLQQVLEDNDRAIGTPQARQKTINGLSEQYRRFPSDGIAAYDTIAPGAAKALTDYQSINQEYQPKTFNDNLQAQGRSIVQRFKSVKETIEAEYNKLGQAAIELEAEIQAKLKAAGYA
jgi:tape measure domain-containing protein